MSIRLGLAADVPGGDQIPGVLAADLDPRTFVILSTAVPVVPRLK